MFWEKIFPLLHNMSARTCLSNTNTHRPSDLVKLSMPSATIRCRACVGKSDCLGRAGGKPKFGPILKYYLVTYNLLNSAGWGYVMLHIISGLLADGWSSFTLTWSNLSTTVWGLQVLVLLDIAHALLGLWGSHPTIPLYKRIWCKVGHRTEIFVTIYLVGGKIVDSAAWAPMLLTWALADIFRFQYYAASAAGLKCQWLTWIRYSMFLVQWPLNLIAEISFIAETFPHLLESNRYGSPFLNYAWIAIFFQLQNCLEFWPGMQKLYDARHLRIK